MEIKIIDGKKNNDIYEIDDFIFRGVTVLGDDVPPAMGELARLEKFSYDYSKELINFSNILKDYGKEEKDMTINEVEVVEIEDKVLITEEKTINKEEVETTVDTNEVETDETEHKTTTVVEETEVEADVETDTDKEEEAKADEDVEVEDVEDVETDDVETNVETEIVEADKVEANENFSLGYEMVYKLIEDELSKVITVIQDWDEDYEVPRFWLRTVLMQDNIVIVEDRENNWKTFGIPFTIKDDVCVLNMEEKAEYIPVWRVKAETEQSFEANFRLEKDFEVFSNKLSILGEEITALRDFKSNVEKTKLEEEVNSLLADFNFCDDEVSELKVKVLSNDITMDAFKKELFALEGMKSFNERKQFSSQQVEKELVKVSKQEEAEIMPYGDLSKYL
jgi:hypothetical protein